MGLSGSVGTTERNCDASRRRKSAFYAPARVTSKDGTSNSRLQLAPAPGSYAVHAALLGFEIRSTVRAGENKGRVLNHDFVALAMAQGTLSKSNGVHYGQLSFNGESPLPGKKTGLAIWVEPSNAAKPLQALGGWLRFTTPKED